MAQAPAKVGGWRRTWLDISEYSGDPSTTSIPAQSVQHEQTYREFLSSTVEAYRVRAPQQMCELVEFCFNLFLSRSSSNSRVDSVLVCAEPECCWTSIISTPAPPVGWSPHPSMVHQESPRGHPCDSHLQRLLHLGSHPWHPRPDPLSGTDWISDSSPLGENKVNSLILRPLVK